MNKTWDVVRKEAAAAGRLDEERVAQHRTHMLAEVRAYRLGEVRKAHGLTQEAVAEAMHISQSRVSRIEKGELDSAEVATLRNYVEALGGHLKLVADFGDQQVTVG
jgi:predicted XRE-type DNA-binding protein